MNAEKLRQYAWLAKEPAPKMLIKALELYGTRETVGIKHNPIILDWAAEVGVSNVYKADEQPWCGLFAAVLAKRSGKPVVDNPLWARNWAKWGEHCKPELGCVLVFTRGDGGHVGLYVGEDDENYFVLGGNQSNCVCIVPIEKDRLIDSRCMYNIKPSNIRAITINVSGSISTNEQ